MSWLAPSKASKTRDVRLQASSTFDAKWEAHREADLLGGSLLDVYRAASGAWYATIVIAR